MKTLICLILVLLISSCSQKNNLTYEERDNAYIQYISSQSLTDIQKINSFRFNDWQSLSRKFLIMSATFKKKYLIEIAHDCYNLEFAQNLVLNQSTSGSLRARLDSISTMGEPNISCRIKAIYPLTTEQAKEIANIGYPTNEKSTAANADS